MICPECGEQMNVIDISKLKCICGWKGSYEKWLIAIDKLKIKEE